MEADEFLGELVVGRVVFAYYRDEPHIWLEGLCRWVAVGQGNKGTWAIRTPDADIYCEDLPTGSPDDGSDTVAFMEEDRAVPKNLEGQVYRSSEEWSEEDLRSFIVEGRATRRAQGRSCGSPSRRSRLHVGQVVSARALCPVAPRGADAAWRREFYLRRPAAASAPTPPPTELELWAAVMADSGDDEVGEHVDRAQPPGGSQTVGVKDLPEVALAPGLANHTTDQSTAQTSVLEEGKRPPKRRPGPSR